MSGRKEIARSYYMVARGNNRNNGANLGPLYLNANNALSNSNGNNWRSRLSKAQRAKFVSHHCRKTRGTVRPTKPETPHNAIGVASAQAYATAVKDAHKRAASRTGKRLEKRKG